MNALRWRPPTPAERTRFHRYPFAALPLRLQSSYEGRIRHVFVGSFPECASETTALCQTLEAHVAPVTAFGRVHRQEYPTDTDIFLRDSFLVTDEGTLLVSPVGHPLQRRVVRGEDRIIGQLSERFPVRSAPFRFEGGGLLQANGTTWMEERLFSSKWNFIIDEQPIATDSRGRQVYDESPANSWIRALLGGPTDGRLTDSGVLYSQLGLRPKFFPGSGVLGHIDLLATPTAPDRMLLADNHWGLEIVQSLGMNELSEFLEQAEEYVAQLKGPLAAEGFRAFFLYLRENGRTPTPRPNVKDSFTRVIDDCDEIARRNRDSTIVRIPSLIGVASDLSICLSYNNSLLESSSDRRLAVVPRFLIRALDDAAHGVIQKERYQTLPVTFIKTSVHGASVRCVTVEKRI